MPFLVFILLSVFALLMFSGLMVFVMGCVRRKELNWTVEADIQKTPYGRHFQNILTGQAFLDKHHAQDVYITSQDGLHLHAVYVPAEDPKGTILLAHGYRSNKLVDFGLVFDFYHQHGMNLLVPDQRAHGKSQGRYITFGVKESEDMKAWIAYHNKMFGRCPMILSGLSMGASTMLYLADAELPDNVKGIIADCGFTSPKEIISTVYRRVAHLPAAPSLWAADLFARIFAGFSLNEKNTVQSLKNSKLPVLMVHGVEDVFVPCEMTQRGYDACTGKKQLFLVEGADHGVSFLVDRPRYTQIVTDFLKENVEGV